MSIRMRADYGEYPTALRAFQAAKGSGDGGASRDNGHHSRRGNGNPLGPWFFALLAALIAAFVVLMAGKEV